MNEIKGTTTPNDVIKDIFKRLNNIDYQAFIVVFDKQNMHKIDYDHNINMLYDILASQLAKIIPIDDRTTIFIDKTKNKNQIDNFNNLFKNKLNNRKNYPVEIKHVNSVNYKGLQIADLISWSSYQTVEYKNPELFKIVENKSVRILCEN